MSRSCFICNVLVGDKNVSDLFAEYTDIDDSVAKLLGEIIDRPISSTNIHSCVLCKQCYSTCLEYDSSKKRMQEIKTEITTAFKITLPKHGMEYNTYPKTVSPRKLVLPASKLQPLPPNYVIDVSKLPKNVATSKPTINLKVTVGSTVLTQSLKTTQSSPVKAETVTDKSVESNIVNSLSSILGVKTATSVSSTTSMLTFNVDSLPKELGEVLEMKKEFNEADDDDDDDLNNDEQPMEIDEECTITKIKEKDSNIENVESDKDTTDKQLFDVSLLPVKEGDNNDTILGKLQILDREEGENEETEAEEIVMADESGSVIRFVVSGQKLVYENGALTLADDDDSGQGVDDNDDHDSADEAQIELQVSGDEETANAIIAAAQEQGGAFIKVESGEMFRVKSVKSQLGAGAGAGEGEGAGGIQMVAVEGNAFRCLLCDRGDKDSSVKSTVLCSAEEMMQHLRRVHDARAYLCPLCRRVLRRRIDYTAHIAECSANTKLKVIAPSDNKSRVHECTQCKKKFTSRSLLNEHMNIHSGARPYTCSVCNKSFASKYTHQAHLKTHLERPRPYKCKKCPKSFLTPQNLSQHEKTHLGIKDFVCNICGKAFGTQHNLEVHGVVHSKNKPFVCGVCGKPFARRAEVKDHMRIHTGERPFACDICGATFTQRSNLNSHKRATHMDDRRYACTLCPKRFKRRRLLNYHTKVSHTGERPLECDVCHATFVYPEHFKKHARIHNGEKPFVCEVCGKSFNSRDNRNTHRFVHSDKKPYECLVCGAGFMRKQLLYAHMNTNGHLAESIVVNQPRVQKVNEKGGATVSKTNTENKLETIVLPTDTSEELELNTTNASKLEEVVISETQDAPKYILQDGKTEINLVQDADDPGLLTFIQNLDGSKQDGALQSISAEQLRDQVQMVTTDETGAIRVVQLHIGASPSAWMVTQ